MDPLALDRQVCFALAAASRSVIGLYRPVLAPLGLTHPQYLAIELTAAGEALRGRALKVPGTIVERLGVPVEQLERVRDELTALLEASSPGGSAR